jgi:uroporphyrin-III C-methyltransferase
MKNVHTGGQVIFSGQDKSPLSSPMGMGKRTLAMQEKCTLVAQGKCTLVGAGPGDPELLTLKAVKAIQAATVLLVDDLVNDVIVSTYAQPGARIVHVGKRGGCKSTPQAFIEKLMIMAAAEGENVVRLKGGDPFIFGRGGEEVEHLQAAGVQVEVVNGITSGLAAVTSLGVPLTHREHAQGVVFVTGHAKPSKNDAGHDTEGSAIESTDWKALAATAHSARLTLVIYMGVSGAAHIERELLHGLPGATPVALIQNASLPTQRHVITTLNQMQHAIVDAKLSSPCIIVVGDVLQGLAAAEAGAPALLRKAG